ncbi:MAG: hypothetical protein NTV22_11190, partial [bacterium]|nr:hypothetical protein [bacterium]
MKKMLKTGTSWLAVVVALVLVAAWSASAITLDRTAGAAVLSVPPLCFTNYNGATQTGGAYPPMNGSATYPCGGMVMIKFDLSAYTSKFIDGEGDLVWRANWSDPTWPVTFTVRQVLSNWNQASVTWANWIGDQTGTTWQAFFGPEMYRLQIPGTVGWPGPLCHFVVSNSVVQQWMTTPAQNYGVALVPIDANGNVTWFAPSATWLPQEDRGQLSFTLLTTNNPPARPTNLTPTNASFGKPLTLTLTSSAYSDPDGNPQTSSWWQLSTRSDFAATTYESGETTLSKTSLVVPAGALKNGTRYFWRVKYKDNAGDLSKWSEWSVPTYFDTQLNLIEPVVLIESQSAMIRPGVYADTNVNGGTESEFNQLNSTTNSAPAGFNMYWFDTRVYSMYTGLVVSANGTLAVST